MNRYISYMWKRTLIAFVLGVVLIVLFAAVAQSEEQNGGVPGDWLSRYAGARTIGMGGAFVATANDPIGVVWNPAGLSVLSQNRIQFETARLYESTSLHSLSFALPGRRLPSFGISIIALRSGDFERTNDLNESLGTFGASDMAFLISTSKNITGRLSVGANLKIIRQSVDEFDAAGVGADLGVLLDVTPEVRIGASLLNVGGPNLQLREIEETYPIEFRGGLSFFFLSGRGLVSAEVNHRSGPGATFHGGSEFWVHRKLALRVGYADTQPSGGMSFRVAPNMRFDYGASYHELGVTHRVALSYRFGGFFASSQAVPPVFSPIGEHSVTKFHLKAKTKAEASSWSLEIVDKSGQVVRRFGGKGTPPAHVMWDGKDESGLPLSDGVYGYQLVVEDEEGSHIEGRERSVEITTGGPQGAVPVIID